MAQMSWSAQLHAIAPPVAIWKELESSEEKSVVGNLFLKHLLRLGASTANGQPFPAASFDTLYDDSVLECDYTMSPILGSSPAAREHKVLNLVNHKIFAPEFRAGGTATLDEVGISIQICSCHTFETSLIFFSLQAHSNR